MKIDLFYEIVSQCMINGVRLAAAFFLYRLLSDFVNKKEHLHRQYCIWQCLRCFIIFHRYCLIWLHM